MSTQEFPQRDLHRGIIIYRPGVHNSNSHTSTQEVGKKEKLGDPMITNNHLVITKNHKQILSQYKILEDRYETNGSSM